MKPGRNDPCPCGSGKKFKHCCERKTASLPSQPASAEVKLLIELFNAGRYAELEHRASALVSRFTNFATGWKLLGNALQMQGKDALFALQRAAELLPRDAIAHFNLACILAQQGRQDDAIASYRLAIKINPDFAEAHNNLGYLLLMRGNTDDALRSCQRALKLKPDFAEAQLNIGNVLKELGQLDAALESYRRASLLKPDYAQAHNNLGNLLQIMGRPDAALASCKRALDLSPDYALAHLNMGNALKDLGHIEDAMACCRRALEINPDYFEAHLNLGVFLQYAGRLAEAMLCYRRALEIKPDHVEVLNNLGEVLLKFDRHSEALACFLHALDREPGNIDTLNNLGTAYYWLGRNDEALSSFRHAISIKPDNPDAHFNLGATLLTLGQPDIALPSFCKALEIQPDFADAHTSKLFCLSHSAAVDATTLFAEHRRFGEQFEAPLKPNWPTHRNARDPGRVLQVGFVSGDLRNHAVAFFLEPVLEHLSSDAQFSLHAYNNNMVEDAVTEYLKGYFKHWYPIAHLSDEVLAHKIQEDSIDILIDLSGHTARNRLLTFARKPAPIQASWMGYPATTGLTAMDYYLADRFFLPPGEYDKQFCEKLVYLPASAPFVPSQGAPPVNALPFLRNGYVTFGSFNRLVKISRAAVALWGELLRLLPDARMMLAGMPEEGKYATLIEWFTEEGIARARLDFHKRSDMQTYQGLHHQVDICLDTFPYTGGTTTLHALWMGVPTLTLAGNTAAGRQGAAILGQTGLDAFVAHDAADFVQKGLAWANHLDELSAIRAGLRERFAQSAMGQPALISAGLGHALRIMWQRWCDSLPPVAIDASDKQFDRRINESG